LSSLIKKEKAELKKEPKRRRKMPEVPKNKSINIIEKYFY
jgi:hypothetical protein